MELAVFFNNNLFQIISTAIVLLLFPLLRYLLNKILKSYSKKPHIDRTRMALIKKSMNFLLVLIVIIILITIWGVKTQNIFLTLSSIFAIIGVALFAQWSVLSNITAGFILFFSTHLRIGDQIQIMDKDFPITAEVEDIKTFYIYLRGSDCQLYVYPNNMLLQKGVAIIDSKKRKATQCEDELPNSF